MKFAILGILVTLSMNSFAGLNCHIASDEDGDGYAENKIATYTNLDSKTQRFYTLVNPMKTVFEDFDLKGYYTDVRDTQHLVDKHSYIVRSDIIVIDVNVNQNQFSLLTGTVVQDMGKLFESNHADIYSLDQKQVTFYDDDKSIAITCRHN